MFQVLRLVLSWIVLVGFPGILLTGIFFVSAHAQAAFVVGVIWVLLWAVLSFTAEEHVVRFFGARASGNRPYFRRRDQALERRLKELRIQKIPRIMIIESPEPQLWVARSAFSRGAVFISEGLMGLLGEVELTAWMSLAVEQSRRPELVLQTVACAAANWVRGLTPTAWTRLLIYGEMRKTTGARDFGVIATLRSLILIQVVRFFLSVAYAGRLRFVELQSQLRRAAQKDAFCFFPLSIYQEQFVVEKNRHSLFLQENLS